MNIPPIEALAALTLAIVVFGVGRRRALRAELSRVVGAFRTGLQSKEKRLDPSSTRTDADAFKPRSTTRP